MHQRSDRPAQKQVIEHTSPVWRVVAVVAVAVGIAAFGRYIQEVGYAHQFATVAVITIGFTVSFWAKKRPDRVQRRFGPFAKIANAIRESIDDIERWVYERPLRVGALIAVIYGVLVVLAQALLVFLLRSLYSWYLTVALAAVVVSIVAAPQLWSGLLRAIRVDDGKSTPPDRRR